MKNYLQLTQEALRLSKKEQQQITGGIGTCIYECDATGFTYRTRARCVAACPNSFCIGVC
jgi:hypothetical protein